MSDPLLSPNPQNTPPLSEASFSLKNRIMRVIWHLAEILFFRYTPRPLHQWRVFVLKCFGARLGEHCKIYRKARIWAPWNLQMGDYSCLADDVICYCQGQITLAEYVVISQGAHLCTGSHDYNTPGFKLFTNPIRIEKNAWICAEAFVGPGVTVNEGAVLGARAVCFKDLPAWSVSTGNPAKFIKQRTVII